MDEVRNFRALGVGDALKLIARTRHPIIHESDCDLDFGLEQALNSVKRPCLA